MMSPFFLLKFSDLDTASTWKGQFWLKILHSASLIQQSDVPDCYIMFIYSSAVQPVARPRAGCGPRTDSVRPAKDNKINFWMKYVDLNDFPELSKCCKKILTMFGSTYVCEAGFSALTNTKSKKRNSLTDEHLENLLRAAVTQYQPEIKQVAAATQSQPSH